MTTMTRRPTRSSGKVAKRRTAVQTRKMPTATAAARKATSEARRLIAALRPRITEQITALIANGGSLSDIGIEQLARRMTATLPSPLPWDEQIGPFYSTQKLMDILGCSRQAINDRVHRSTLLALRTRDDVLVYPMWQFEGDHVVAGLGDVLALFRGSSVDAWLLASWLRAPQTSLGERSVVDWLIAGYDVARVLELARAAKSRWVE